MKTENFGKRSQGKSTKELSFHQRDKSSHMILKWRETERSAYRVGLRPSENPGPRQHTLDPMYLYQQSTWHRLKLLLAMKWSKITFSMKGWNVWYPPSLMKRQLRTKAITTYSGPTMVTRRKVVIPSKRAYSLVIRSKQMMKIRYGTQPAMKTNQVFMLTPISIWNELTVKEF